VQIIARWRLVDFWTTHPRAETSLRAWFQAAHAARWQGPADVRRDFGSADFIADHRVIFNIAGNRYRLVAHIDYLYKRVLVKFVGTHADYDRIDPETVE